MSRSIRRWIWFAKPYGADRHRHGTFPSLSITERTPGYEPGSVRSNRAGKAFEIQAHGEIGIASGSEPEDRSSILLSAATGLSSNGRTQDFDSYSAGSNPADPGYHDIMRRLVHF